MVTKPYVAVSGPMDAGVTDDVLLVSPSGSDYLWRGNSDRTVTSVRRGLTASAFAARRKAGHSPPPWTTRLAPVT